MEYIKSIGHDLFWGLYNNSWTFKKTFLFYKYVLKIDWYYQVFIVLLFVILAIIAKRKKYSFYKGFALSVVIPYVVMLYSSLVLSRDANEYYLYSFEVLWSLKGLFSDKPELIKEIITNNLMLIPFGLLCPILFNNKKWRTICIGIFISVSIEFLQLITKTGMCEIDDVIYNTVGLLFGYGLYFLIAKIKKSYKNKQEKKNV